MFALFPAHDLALLGTGYWGMSAACNFQRLGVRMVA